MTMVQWLNCLIYNDKEACFFTIEGVFCQYVVITGFIVFQKNVK